MAEDSKKDRGPLRFARRYTEALVSVAALVTAVAAVVITMEQTKVMREEAALERKNARISVMPSVWIGTHIANSEDEAYFRVVLTNKGLGPAVIERFDVAYKGEPVYNWDDLARRIEADIGSEKTFVNGTLSSSRSPVSPGIMLEAGGSSEPLSVYDDTDIDGLKLLMRGAQNMSISLCYCSLYGDCFRAELFRRPLEVEACGVPEQEFISHGFFRK